MIRPWGERPHRLAGRRLRCCWLAGRHLLIRWIRKARPFVLAAVLVGAVALVAGNSDTDRFDQPLMAPPSSSEAVDSRGSRVPWGVRVPADPSPTPDLRWPHIGYSDLPELTAPDPHVDPSTFGAASRAAAAGHSDGFSTWVLPAVVIVAIAVAALQWRRRLGKPGSGDEVADELAVVEGDDSADRESAETAPHEPSNREVDPTARRPRSVAANGSGLVPLGAGSTTGAPATEVPDGTDIWASPTGNPGRRTSGEGQFKGTATPHGAAAQTPQRGEGSSSRVVLFERSPWGR